MQIEGMKSFMFFDEELRTLTVDTTGLGDEIRGTYQLKIILTDPIDVKKSYDYLINIFRSPSTVVAEWAPEIEEEKEIAEIEIFEIFSAKIGYVSGVGDLTVEFNDTLGIITDSTFNN